MKDRDSNRHPGPFRVMREDAEFAGILVAVSFVVLGLVGLPIAKWFLLGAGAVGIVVALIFRFVRGKGVPQPLKQLSSDDGDSKNR